MPSELDEGDLYVVVRRAVRDAIWDVLGTLMTVVFVGLLFILGFAVVASGLQAVPDTRGLLAVAFGLVLMAIAVLQMLREFRLPPFR